MYESISVNTLITKLSVLHYILLIPLSGAPWCTLSSAHGAKCWSPFPPSLHSALFHSHSCSSVFSLFVCAHLQQFVEVLNVTFLNLLCRDLRLFEMDVLVVKCLKEERDKLLMSAVGSIQTKALRSNTWSISVIRGKSCVITVSLPGWSLVCFSNVISSLVFDCFLFPSLFSLSLQMLCQPLFHSQQLPLLHHCSLPFQIPSSSLQIKSF